MISFVVEAIRERCASFRSLTATVSEICGGQTNVPILVVQMDWSDCCFYKFFVLHTIVNTTEQSFTLEFCV